MELFKQADWIWLDGYDTVNAYVTFYDKATVTGLAGTYKMYLSVDTNYALYINGKQAATGQDADYPFDKIYDELDVTEYLREGENEIIIDCWHQGDDSSTIRGEKAGLIYVLTCGDKILAKSSTATTAAPNVRYRMGAKVEHVSGQLGRTFYYDSTLGLPTAVPAVTTEKPLPTRVRPIEKLVIGDDEPAYLTVRGRFTEEKGGTIGQKMQYASLAFEEPNVHVLLPNKDGVTLDFGGKGDGVFAMIDTGRENAGFLSLDIDVPTDAEVLIGWGEHLEDLRVRSYVGGRNFCASYTAHAGRNTFVNPFRRLGLRYLQIHIYAPSAKIYYTGIRTTDYPLSHDITFTCADKLHNKIHEVCKRTLLLSMHEHYEDCPWREQALYSMDSRNQMLCGYYVFKEFDFAKAAIRTMAQSIREDNMLELCSPARVSITIPSFSAIFLTQVYEYLKYSGDKEFVTEMLPYLNRIADEFLRRMDNEKGLIQCFKEAHYWNFYEWQDGLAGSISGNVKDEDLTYDAPLCGFVSFGFRSLADIYNILGDTASAEHYRNAHNRLNASINKYFWDDARGAYASYINDVGEKFHYSELTNSLIVYADAAEGDRLDKVLENLNEKRLIYVTISHSIFKYDALMRKTEIYARDVFADIADQWGSMLYNNATTFWETIEGALSFGNAGSLCHGWSAIPIYFYHQYALNMDGQATGLYECEIHE